MRIFRTFAVLLAATTSSFALTPDPAEAQLRRILNRAENVARRSIEGRLNRAIDNAVYCAIGDVGCAEQAREDGNTPVFEDRDGNPVTDEDGNPITDPEEAEASVEDPGTGVWRNYSFVTGPDIWYALDLTDAVVGRIPTGQIEYIRGNLQTVELDGAKVIESSNTSTFRIPLPDNLPDRFTVEFDYQAEASGFGVRMLTTTLDEGGIGRYPNHYIYLYRTAAIVGPEGTISSLSGFDNKEPVHYALQVDRNEGRDDDYVIGYGGFQRYAQIPNGKFARGNVIEFHMEGNANLRTYISNIVVAVKSEAPLVLELLGMGTSTTRGLRFDYNSARLRPQSTPTLNEILTALEENPDMRLAIEGHTDGAGDDDYNQELSEERAGAVVTYLVENGIDSGRLTAVGKGESEPVGDNETEAGRRRNRRVVLRLVD